MAKAVKFTSFNVNGLNGPVKRKREYDYLKKLKTEIGFIQESHLSKTEHEKLKREWVGQYMLLHLIQNQEELSRVSKR